MAHPRTQLVILLLFQCIQTFAGIHNYPAGARSASLAHSSVALSTAWSAHHNQAGLARFQKLKAGVFYERRYNLSELGIKAAMVAHPTQLGTWGLNYTQYGYDLFQESKIGLTYARALGKHIWAGIQLDYFEMKLNQEYGKKSLYTFEVGLQARLTEELEIGFHIFNPNQAQLTTRDYQEPLPTRARLGLAWHPSKQLILTLETDKDLDAELRVKGGIEYQVLEQIHLRVGAASNPEIISLGLGFLLSPIRTDIAFTRHPVLGNTPSISLNLEL